MPSGGQRIGAGRKSGVPNKVNKVARERALVGGLLPLDYMLGIMRDQDADSARRDEMARAAAPYIHSKMPMAIVTPPAPPSELFEDDENILNLYTSGLHAEADQG